MRYQGHKERGGALLFLLIVSMTILVVVTALVSFVSSYSNTGFATQDLLARRLVLNGMMDYTVLALKQRWCLTDDWQRAPAADCTLAHERNAERLFLKGESVDVLRELSSSDPSVVIPNPVIITEFEGEVSFDQLRAPHPLAELNELLIRSNFQTAIFKIKRLENTIIASQGDESYIRVTIEVTDSTGHVSMIESLNAFFPREVASFGLIAQNLEIASPQSPATMQERFAKIEAGLESDKGLTFKSPVFVNKAIDLPRGAYTSQANTQYAPVTFLAPVIIGYGGLLEGGQLFIPESSDSAYMPMYANSKAFGGFKGGLILDGQLDRGLSVLVNEIPNANVDTALADRCIQRNNFLADLQQSKRSELVIKQISNTGPGETQTAQYLLGYSGFNEFNPMGTTRRLNITNASQFNVETLTGPANQLGILELTVQVNGAAVRYRLAPGNEVELELGGQDATLTDNRSQLETTINDLSNVVIPKLEQLVTVKTKLDRIAELEAKGTTITPEEQTELDNLKTEEALLNTDYNNLAQDLRNMGRLQTASPTLSAATAALQTARTDLTTAQQERDAIVAITTARPLIRISLSNHVVLGHPHPGLVRLNLFAENTANIAEAVSIQIEGYDVGYGPTETGGNFESKREVPVTRTTGYSTRGEIDLWDESGNRFRYQSTSNTWRSADLAHRYTRTIQSPDPPDETENLFHACATSSDSNMLPYAKWDRDFSPYANHSWSFTNRHDDNDNLTINAGAATPGNVKFDIRSIMNQCTIKPSAEIVTGFYHCKSLRIEGPRDKPLKIIGTFIVHSMVIEKGALTPGIDWSTIYHPESVNFLRQDGVPASEPVIGILAPHPNIPPPYNTCDPNPNIPVWHPNPSPYIYGARYSCNASSLRARSQAFQWSAVEPDCALLQGESETRCKKHVKRYIVKEYGRTVRL